MKEVISVISNGHPEPQAVPELLNNYEKINFKTDRNDQPLWFGEDAEGKNRGINAHIVLEALGHDPEEKFDPEDTPAMWHSQTEDQPIIVTGIYGVKDGEVYYQIKGSDTWVPKSEIEWLKTESSDDNSQEIADLRSKIDELTKGLAEATTKLQELETLKAENQDLKKQNKELQSKLNEASGQMPPPYKDTRKARERVSDFLRGRSLAAMVVTRWPDGPKNPPVTERVVETKDKRRGGLVTVIGAAALVGFGYWLHSKTGHNPNLSVKSELDTINTNLNHVSNTQDTLVTGQHDAAKALQGLHDQGTAINQGVAENHKLLEQLQQSEAHEQLSAHAANFRGEHLDFYNNASDSHRLTGAQLPSNLHLNGVPKHEVITEQNGRILKKVGWTTKGIFNQETRDHLRKWGYKVTYGKIGGRYTSIIIKA